MNSLLQPSYGHPAWIEIDLRQFRRNIDAIRQYIGRSKLCLPIKGNAYGHGLLDIAAAGVAAGVDYLAVSCLQEGVLLRKAGITLPVLVLGAIHEAQITELIRSELDITISSLFKAKLVAEHCEQLQRSCRVHIEIETGMQRTGMRPTSSLELLNFVNAHPCFQLVGVYSHLATADCLQDAVAQKQIQIFRDFINTHIKPKCPEINCHIANSGGVCYYPESHLDMVRVGLLAYGYFPSSHHPEALQSIAPFFSVRAKISYFKVVAKGEGISYGHRYITPEDSRIVTVPVGYGDGYRRVLSNKAHVLIRGNRYPIVGTICMDQFMVNINHDIAYVGDEVTLIGRQLQEEISLMEISQLADTIPYEILCGFNNRLPRLYLD